MITHKIDVKYKGKVLTRGIITSAAVLLGLYLNNASIVKADSLTTNQDILQTSSSEDNEIPGANDQNESSVAQDTLTNTSQISESETTTESNRSESEASDLARSLKEYIWNGVNVTFDDTTGVLTIPGGTENVPLILDNPVRIFNNLYGSNSSSFGRYDAIKEIRITGKIKLKGTAKELFSLSSIETISGLGQLDTSEVTNMRGMFYGCSKLTSLDVTSFNTSNVTDMSLMFYDCSALASLDVSNFDTSQVNSMHFMFFYCENLTKLEVNNFDTSKVTTFNAMFQGCWNITDLNVSNFDTSKAIVMRFMFGNCKALTKLEVNNFDTSQVTDMQGMFFGCDSLTKLEINNFDTSQVIDMAYMFTYCKSLANLDVSHFDTSKVTKMQYMFYGCVTLTNLEVNNFDTSQVTDIYCMFARMNLTRLDLSGFDMGKVRISDKMLAGLPKLKILVLGPKCNIRNAGIDKEERYLEESYILNPNSNWVNVADGTIKKPKGDKVWKPIEMMANYNGYTDADTYVRFGIVKAHYHDKDGNKIANDQETRGLVDEDYTSVTKLLIPGYSLKEVRGNNTGIYEDAPKEIIYIYAKNPDRPTTKSKVIVHYQDENGNQIASDEVLTGNVGGGYQTVQKTLLGYTFKEVRGNTIGFFTTNLQTITYIYIKNASATTISTSPTMPNKNKYNVINNRTVADKNRQKETKPLSGDPNKANSDTLPQTGPSKEDKGILSILGSMMLLVSSIGGACFKRKQK